ncbi:unnamed protein product, partial [Mesorhabditis belari]|uniref:Protein kinase domain-containing protein n=1 Tax=Mesorhabditis belari TaxID=2138241 RepID=A0AAF3FJX1_9BILA
MTVLTKDQATQTDNFVQQTASLTKSQPIRIEPRPNERELLDTIPSNYRPDLNEKTSARPESLDKNVYHRLGEGSLGIAIAAIRETKESKSERVVLKRFKFDPLILDPNRDTYTSMLREFQNLQYLSHENIAEMKDSFWSLNAVGNLDSLWIVTERMTYTLDGLFRHRAQRDGGPNEKPRDHRELGSMIVQILRALDYLHQMGIMHRDVKPANIGINSDSHLKIFDFGVARSINTNNDRTHMASTPLFQPLEVQLGQQYDRGVDIWSTGLVVLEFLNNPLYDIKAVTKKEQIVPRILEVFGLPEDKYEAFFGDRLKAEQLRESTFEAFLDEGLKRLGPSVKDLNEKNLKDLLTRLLTINPRRPLANDLLRHAYLKETNAAILRKMDDPSMEQSTGDPSRTPSQTIQIDCEKDTEGKAKIITALIPSDYRPDLSDTSYRSEGLDEKMYHKIGEGSTVIAVAALREIKGLFGIKTERYLMHDNIAEMRDSFWSFGEQGILNHVWIVTERMDFKLSDFFRQMKKRDATPKPELRDHRHLGSILIQTLQGLDYLHQRGIMHRDVKPDNIGITKQFKLKLFDFGVARPINDMKDLTESVSTPLYLPLEVQLVEQYDWGVDIWSTGLLVLEFLNCPLYPPTVNSKEKIKQRILDVFGLPGDKYKEFFKNKLLIERSRDGVFHTFLTEAFKRLDSAFRDLNEDNLRDLLSKMLCINPRRPLASELLDHEYLKAMNSDMTRKHVQISGKDHHAKDQRDKETLIKMLKNFSRQL